MDKKEIDEWRYSEGQELKANDKEKEEDEFEEVFPETPNIWMPREVGEMLTGEVNEIADGQYGIYAAIQKEDGSIVQTPAHKILQSRIAMVFQGDKIKIEYRGIVKSQNMRDTRNYRVFTK